MRTITATLAALIAVLVPACSLYTGDDATAEPDAAPAIDARTDTCPPYWPGCPVGALRSRECVVLCQVPTNVCNGASAIECHADCIAEAHTWTGYCP